MNVFELIKEKLEEVSFVDIDEQYADDGQRMLFLYDAISIVDEVAKEYNNGWIPCSSGNFSTSEVLVCKEDGTIDFDVFDFMDLDWKFNSNHHKNKVIAWQPLPAPYKEGGTE